MYNLHKNILKVVKVVKEKQTGRCNQVGKGALFPGPSLQLSGQVGGELPQPCTHTQPQRLQGGGASRDRTLLHVSITGSTRDGGILGQRAHSGAAFPDTQVAGA